MKVFTKQVHTFVKGFSLENFFLTFGKIIPLFLKFIPLHHEYPVGKRKVVRRSGVRFDLELSDYMQWHVYARQTDNSWKKALLSLENEGIILDVGANCGAFSLPLAYEIRKRGYQMHIHAFEPNPLIFEKLQSNLKLNQSLDQYVHLHPLGIGNEKGEFGMAINQSNSGHGRVISGAALATHTIQLTTLDDFVKEKQLTNICFLKIDVEGYEPLVLKGAENVINKFKPGLFIEVTENWYLERNYSQIDLFKYLEGLGYILFVEKEKKFVKIDNPNRLYSNKQFNLWAIYEN